MSDLQKFLQHRCCLLQSLGEASSINNTKPNHSNNPSKQRNQDKHSEHKQRERQHTFAVTNKAPCPKCGQSHLIYHCQEFINLPISERINVIKGLNLCLNCLRANHKTNQCNSGKCRVCSRKHNTMLHISSEETGVLPQDGTIVHHVTQPVSSRVVILPTAIIKVYDSNGNTRECRALLDSGSQSNFITSQLAQGLKLKLQPSRIPVMGVNKSVAQVRNLVTTRIRSRLNDFESDLTFLVLSTITENLPQSNLEINYHIPEGIKLADPSFDKPGTIDMLIGAELFWDLMCIGQIKSTQNHPTLQKTHFGWIVSGCNAFSPLVPSVSRCFLSSQLDLQQELKKFWVLEEFPSVKYFSQEESECETSFQTTTTRDSTGRFVVRLPTKPTVSDLGDSYNNAVKRLLSLERKLSKDPDLHTGYTADLDNYLKMGHMTRVPIEQIRSEAKPIFYLPHHAVLKNHSTTSKLRVVFDGSAPSSNGTSLNDHLMVGPCIQDDLLSIILRFRCHRHVITADIEKMYRQVKIHSDDSELQRVLWRANTTSPIKTYRLNTVTFGTASAPFLAVRCLHQLAIEESKDDPEIAKIITKDFYIDDLLTGADTRKELVRLKSRLTDVLAKGSFPLHKWNSTCAELREIHAAPTSVQLTRQDPIKTLGIYWDSTEDTFSYVLKPTTTRSKCTKRHILTVIAGLFDPLGLLGPVIIVGKIIIQQLWQIGSGWDESVPMSLFSRWRRFERELESLNDLRIPRLVKCLERDTEVHIHGFCDASESAYGACVYFCTRNLEGRYSSSLLCAKSRVAPLRTVTIPRLELCSTLLLARLVNKVTSSLNVKPNSVTLWSDSTIALAWLSSSPHQWKIFVANRTTEIQSLSKGCTWAHVRSEENPADMLSRGIPTSQIGLKNHLWWHGPNWLRKDKKLWPISSAHSSLIQDLPDHKANMSFLNTSTPSDIFTRFSSLTLLIRVVAYCLRFIRNCRSPHDKHSGHLTRDDYNKSLNRLIHKAQLEIFPNEINMLKNSKPLPPTSRLLSLSPFIDGDLLRVGGRLRYCSTISNDQRHPILLPSQHPLTTLIIRNEHVKHLHAGTSGTLAAVRQRFWPISGRRSTQGIIRACIPCFRSAPRQQHPMMGQLPSRRITPSRPFSTCGVDFAGPFFIHQGGPRSKANVKAYLSIFVCFATRAVHLELVSALSTEAFLATLKRFIGRRGRPNHIYSDNATNFTGVDKELKELRRKFTSENHQARISSHLAEDGIQWHFIPPASPHFGGIWEAAVKSAKRHLSRVVCNAHLTFEEMCTFFIQIESCLNSRPISPLSADPNDLSVLTPGHFLIGDALTAIAEPSLCDLPKHRLSRWQHVQKLTQHFWSRWTKEYLSLLQQRHKWKVPTEPLLVGCLVLIRDERLPPLKWPLGRVTGVHPGQDGVVRVVTVRTVSGFLKRASSKLCVLPLDK